MTQLLTTPYPIKPYKLLTLDCTYFQLPKLDYVTRAFVTPNGHVMSDGYRTRRYSDLWDIVREHIDSTDLPVECFDVLVDIHPRNYHTWDSNEPFVQVIDCVCDKDRLARWEYCKEFQKGIHLPSLDLEIAVADPKNVKDFYAQGYKGLWLWDNKPGYKFGLSTAANPRCLEVSNIRYSVCTIIDRGLVLASDRMFWTATDFFTGRRLLLERTIPGITDTSENLPRYENWFKDLSGKNVLYWSDGESLSLRDIPPAYFEGFIVDFNFEKILTRSKVKYYV